VDAARSRSPRYVALLAFAAGLILLVGWFARPRSIPQSPPPLPSETELAALARRAERRSLEDMSKFFGGIAGDVEPSLAYIRSGGSSGIVWDEHRIVTGPLPASSGAELVPVSVGPGEAKATVGIWGPNLPVSTLVTSSSPSGASPARRATTQPQAGDWIVAVWQTGQASAFAATNFRQSSRAACGSAPIVEIVSSLSLTRAMVGGGLFNMDGELLAVILPCPDRIAALEPTSVDELLERADTLEQRVLARYGVLCAAISDEERLYFKDAGGILVREIWNGSIAAALGLWPGDIVTALNGQTVAAVDDLKPLVGASAEPLELRVQRGTRTLAIALRASPAVSAPVSSGPNAGLVLESPPTSFRIDSVAPDSRAARAGIQPGDRILRVNRTAPRNPEQARRLLTAGRPGPALLEVERGTRRIAVVLPEGDSR
jgi:serine protease Do